MKTIIKYVPSRIWLIVTSLLLVLAIVFNLAAFVVIPKVFENLWGGDTGSGRQAGNFTADDGIASKADSKANGNAINELICEEGFVLLKNDGNILPLATSSSAKAKVSVFGKNSVNLVYGGSGSGAGDLSGAKTVKDSLEAAGYEVNPNLWSFYQGSASGSGRPNSLAIEAGIPTGFATGETPVSSYTDEVKSSFSQYGDLALVVISRTCGEGNDVPTAMTKTTGAFSDDDHYWELDKNEQEMLQMVCENFSKVALIINSSQTFELGFLDSAPDGDDTVLDYDFASHIKGAIWIGGPGESGVMALGRILNGSVNPSGRTVDTYARDFTQSPAYVNFSFSLDNNISSDTYYFNDKAQDAWYSDYEEGIYVGYRYYETRGYTDGEEWYAANVVYPFGYGLSYTSFNWSITNKSALDGKALGKDDTVTVKVHVDNVGDYAGKDVVELYVRAPYTAGGIEKADKVLCAFVKTPMLDKNGGADVELTFSAYDLASYDCDGVKVAGGGYILEAGNYEFFVSRNAHEAVDSFTMKVDADILFPTDSVTGTAVANVFEDIDDQLTQRLSRSDWEGTWPKKRTMDERVMTAEFKDQVNSTATNNPLTADSAEIKNANLTVASKKDKMVMQLTELIGASYDDPKWDEFLQGLTVNTMMEMLNMGAFGTGAVDYITKPKTIEPDGPVGFTQFMGGSEIFETVAYASECVVASTWNVELAEAEGTAVGNEALMGDGSDPYSGWYAPALNLHRTPFGGRNYEYYSEDPVLTGNMAAGVVKGAWSKGVYTYMKHFAVNESETHRNGICTWLTEQTLRELYLKPFEIAIKKSDNSAHGVMSSFNRVGSLWTGGDWRLLTQVLRNEWGFQGCVITDFATGSYMNNKQMTYAGGDLYLNNVNYNNWVDKSVSTDVYVLKNAAKNYLYNVANSNAMNGLAEGNYTTQLAAWKVWVFIGDGVLAAALALWGVFAIRGAYKKKKKNAASI